MSARANRFLASLGEDIELIRPHLRETVLLPGQVLWEPGDTVSTVFFLDEGAISKLTVFADGTEIECALIGRDGAVGATSAIGLKTAITRDVCLLKARASCIETGALEQAAQISERVHHALDDYCAWKMRYIIRNGACNALHSVEQRLCRWLLTCTDVLERQQIDVTQDIFAKMLGVQRTSVNATLRRLQADGLIRIGRGRLILAAPSALIDRACRCYCALRMADVVHPQTWTGPVPVAGRVMSPPE
ncbi:MAG TPA: Crp/Fnr family transcriptional regulator [Caulobacteraceae bacterium]|jgi:CRP-like cAMP-binding protein|nr:Crp/Fnr family transcriptional regulator [Caulobacteraceae bacterium]